MKTIASYDEIPYESFAIPETHPDYLATAGRLLGLPTADPEACRVLELGTATGGNLIPMAFHLPGSEFVGIELSAEQARRGQSMAAELGLTNLRLLHQDILEVDASQRPFDFILVHGVYSWVPEAVRERILQLCGRLLSERGIAYVSYNVLPGWRQRGMLRDMLLFHCRGATSPGERLGRARGLLELLAEGLDGDARPEAEMLRREVAYLRSARASYLYHEYLAETNAPELFSDFMARARRQGLEFLGEAKLHTMFVSTLGPAAEAALDGLGGQSVQEQYMDFLRLRPFRQTLLVRAEARPCLEIDLERLYGFPLYADLQPLGRVQLGRIETQEYGASDGGRLQVAHPLTKAVLAQLAQSCPNALTLDELLRGAAAAVGRAGGGRHADETDACLSELFSLYVSQGVGLTLCSTRWQNRIGPRPEATRLARAQAASGEGHVASVRHRSLRLDALAARVLTLLDGRRDRDALLAELGIQMRTDPALSAAVRERTRGQDRLDQVSPAGLERVLAALARAGLLGDAEGGRKAKPAGL